MAKFTSNPSSVAYTAAAGRLGPLNNGVYYITSSSASYFLQGGSGVTATASSNPLWANQYIRIVVSDTSDAYVSFIQQAAGGTGYALAGQD